MENKTAIYMNDAEVKSYLDFCNNRAKYEAIVPAWKQVIEFTAQLGSGNYNLTVQNGLPVRINNPLQTVVIGIKL